METIDFPPFRLDLINQCVWLKGSGEATLIHLTPKAFSMLRYLGQRSGSLVTQDELLAVVWPGVVVQPQVVKAHVLEIRKALGDDARMPMFVETVPRRGYRFIGTVRRDALARSQQRPSGKSRIVGRDQELALLAQLMRRSSDGMRQIVFVTGEPGIGKSALLDEFEFRVATNVQGLRIARGQCVEGYGGKEAHYPMLEALGHLCRGSGGDAIVATLATHAPTWLAQLPGMLKREHRDALQREIMGATRERMVREICAALEVLTETIPLLLVFEDLQWTDHSTVDLISALARSRGSARLMLAGTFRPVDLILAEHPLRALKQDLLVRDLICEIPLGPLAATDITEFLLAQSAGGDASRGLANLLHRHSDGNPLFMVAALDHLVKQGLVSHESGGWELRAAIEELELGVPESLRQMIEARIERLSEEEKRVLEAASVIGIAFPVDVVAGTLSTGAENLEEVFEDLARRHHMIRAAAGRPLPGSTDSPRYEFIHALYREVLYRRQGPTRRARLHARIGECLEMLFAGRLSEVAPELAYHYERGADWARGVKFLRLQADEAGRRHAHREATAMLRQAFDLSSKLSEPLRTENETKILEKLATIYVASFDMRAIETYEALREKAVLNGMADADVNVLAEMASFLSWISSERCLAIVDRMLKLNVVQTDALQRAKTNVSCHYLRLMVDRWDPDLKKACLSSFAPINRDADPGSSAAYRIDFAHVQLFSSEYREANRAATSSRAALFDSGEEDTYLARRYWPCQIFVALSHMFLGEWGEALREIDATIAMLVRNGDDNRLPKTGLYRAWIHLQAVDFSEALSICESILHLVERDPARHHLSRLALMLAGAAEVSLGHVDPALEHLTAAREEMEHERVTFDWYWRPLLESALTEVWLAKGDLGRASAQASTLLEAALSTEERTFRALAHETNARVAMADGNMKLARNHIAEALEAMVGFEVPLAAWRVHATAAKLHRAAEERELERQHREEGSGTVRRLAKSLDAYPRLQQRFRSAPAVVALLRRDPGSRASAEDASTR